MYLRNSIRRAGASRVLSIGGLWQTESGSSLNARMKILKYALLLIVDGLLMEKWIWWAVFFFFFLEIWYPFLLLLNKDFDSPSFSIQWFSGTDFTPGCLGEHVSSSQWETFHSLGHGYFVHRWVPNPIWISDIQAQNFSLYAVGT